MTTAKKAETSAPAAPKTEAPKGHVFIKVRTKGEGKIVSDRRDETGDHLFYAKGDILTAPVAIAAKLEDMGYVDYVEE